MVLEGEMLYNMKGEVPDGDYTIPLGKAQVKREGDHVTIVSYGKMINVANQAADLLAKDGIRAEVIDLLTLRPLDAETVVRERCARRIARWWWRKGWEICGMGAQVVDYVQRDCFDDLDAPVLRVHQADVPMPYAKNLERAAKPDAQKTVAAVRQVLYLD